MRIRAVRHSELPLLQALERAAGEPFRSLGMPEIADDDPPSLGMLESYRKAHRAWVVTGPTDPADPADPEDPATDRPIGYLIADLVDDAAHIEQISVDPAAARRGVGRLLVEHLALWAADQGLRALTLTTFTDVPWNAPYYTRLGFRTLAEGELSEGLRRVRAEEAEHGLDRWPRVCMRRELSGKPGEEE